MKSKQVISLLLAGQILSAPMAQAASLSLLDKAQAERQRTVQAQEAESPAHSAAETTPIPEQTKTPETTPSAEATPVTEQTKAPAETGEAEPSAAPTASVLPAGTPAPAESPEATPVDTMPPAASSAPTMTAAPTVPPSDTPAATPDVTASPSQDPEATASASPSAAESPEAIESETPVVTQTPEVTPSAEPSATPSPTAAPVPTPTATPLPEDMLLPQMMLLADLPAEKLFTTAYIGYGYETYHAGKPLDSGKAVTKIQNAVMAVEKPDPNETGEKSDFVDGAYFIAEESMEWDGADVDSLEFEIYDPTTDSYSKYRLNDLAKRLGRLPDYQFDGWFVSAMGPVNKEGSEFLWTYTESEKDWKQFAGDTGVTIIQTPTERTMERDPKQDYRLTYADGTSAEIDVSGLRDVIIDSNDKRTVWNEENSQERNIGYWYGPDWSDWADSNDLEKGVYLPIIAHWELSSDATLVATAARNPDDPAVTTEAEPEETSALYLVKNGETTTVNLLSEGITGDESGETTGVTLYDKPLGDNDSRPVTFDFGKGGTYYLRVNSNMEGIVPSLLTSEAFKAAEAAGGVSISFRAAGTTDKAAVEYGCSQLILNDSIREGTKVTLYNNRQYPMRSKWTLDTQDTQEYIPLARSHVATYAGNASEEEKRANELLNYYNELTITVTAPDGKATNVYTFYIQRLNDPRVEQNPGNTPLGMIARDQGKDWMNRIDGQTYSTEEQVKAGAKKAWAAERSFSTSYHIEKGFPYPNDEFENNKGSYDKRVYWDGAWTMDGFGDVDLDENAIVVYQDASFVDPGITVYNSQGEKVELSGDNIKRSVVLRVSEGPLSLKDLKDDSGVLSYYSGSQMTAPMGDWEGTFQVITNADGRDRIDLRGVRVLPGFYTIEYEYTDPLSGLTYNSKTADNFSDKEANNAATFRRTLIILPMPGDVDMDGAVTPADAEWLQRALLVGTDQQMSEFDVNFLDSANGKVVDLYKLRVCDVNNDGKVDTNDVDAIRAGFSPSFTRNETCMGYFYIPLHMDPAGGDEEWRQRQSWKEAAGDGKAAVSLEYLGLNTAEIAGDAEKLAKITNVDEQENIVALNKGDVFWVGVKVSGVEKLPAGTALRGGIAALRLSIAYDNTYLEPVLVREDGTVSAVDENNESAWVGMLRRYNISEDQGGSATTDKYLWPRMYEFISAGTWPNGIYGQYSQSQGSYQAHFSKAILPGESSGWSMRQLSVTLRSTQNAYRVLYSEEQDKEQYLLRIPFRLKERALNATTVDALDLALGMQDLNLLSEQEIVGTGESQISAAWSSSTEGIFGGGTHNLASELSYVSGSARSIPLADDTGEDWIELKNQAEGTVYGETVYGETYSNLSGLSGQAKNIASKLPKGLSYDETNGKISGVPEEVGRFDFEADDPSANRRKTYYIKVEKAPVTLYAVGQRRYYGEPNDELDYRYDPSDIKDVDKSEEESVTGVAGANYKSGFVNNGSAKMLSMLDGYRGPSIDTTANQGTGAGEYAITISGGAGSGLTNYKFLYADGKMDAAGETEMVPLDKTDETAGKTAASPLVIDRRPLLLSKLKPSAMTTVTVGADELKTRITNIPASYQKDGLSDFALVPLSDAVYAGKALTAAPVYGDDKVTVTFTSTWELDHTSAPYFDVPEGHSQTTKETTISELKLADNDVNKNYVLLAPGLRDATGVVTVLANPVVKIDVEQFPNPSMEYTYNGAILFYPMQVTLTYQDGSTRKTQYINEDSLNSLGIHVTYVTESEMKAGQSGWIAGRDPEDQPRRLVDRQVMRADTHDGMYLCVSVEGYDAEGNPKSICWYGGGEKPKPFRVYKKTLTLTVKNLNIYYGEYQENWLEYTYDPMELSKEDRDLIWEEMKKESPDYAQLEKSEDMPGAAKELEKLAGYVRPALSAWTGAKDTSEKITAHTPVLRLNSSTIQSYTIYIENQKDKNGNVLTGASNYSFRYMNGSVVGDEGVGTLTIHPRPIVVDTVTLGLMSKAFLYDDTRNTKLAEMYHTEENEQGEKATVASKVTISGLNGAADTGDTEEDAKANADTFIAKIPGERYFNAYTTGSTPTQEGFDYGLSGNAIYSFSLDGETVTDNVVVTYVATYAKENPSASPPASTYFNMGGQTEKTTNATISTLALAPAAEDNANGNYVLVYNTQSAANTARPVTAATQGLLKLRPLKSVNVVTDPMREDDYVYGEQLKLEGMSISMAYESEWDNDPASNAGVIDRTVNYLQTGSSSDSFADQGLYAYWILDGDLEFPDAGALTQETLDQYLNSGKLERVSDNGGYPDVAKSGKRLLLCGRRYSGEGAESAGHVLVWSVTTDEWNFKMVKKTLPLTVEGQSRFYGEPNTGYRASFPYSALAKPDQDGLPADLKQTGGVLYLTAVSDPDESTDTQDVSKIAANAVLSELNKGYLEAGIDTDLGVRFTTPGTRGSDVGSYSIGITVDEGNLANYEFSDASSAPATLCVFRRPIMVSKIYQDPVSTIFRDTEEREFPAQVTQEGQMTDGGAAARGFMTQLPVENSGEVYKNLADAEIVTAINQGKASWDMFTVTGSAIYGQDKLTVGMTAVFPEVASRVDFAEGKYQAAQPVTIKGLSLGGGDAENYCLVFPEELYREADGQNGIMKAFLSSPLDDTAAGRLDCRPITAIQNKNLPKMEYTYGDTLDLSELMLTVTFENLGGDMESYPETQDLTYAELSGRLSVNYWTPGKAPEAPTEKEYQEIVSLCKAATGDHLTIAPSHEDKFKDRNGNYIFHDGKYLILTVRASKDMPYQAKPILVGTSSGPVPLTVEPLDLKYTLKAENKVYDEANYATRSAAAGSITLTNPYVTTKTVTQEDGNGGTTAVTEPDRDLIYVAADASYTDEELKDYLNSAASAAEAYTFTTAGGKGSDGIAFNFYDENVMYYEGEYTEDTPVAAEKWEAYWRSISHTPKTSGTEGWDSYGDVAPMPVLVSNISLRGPDAANYTLDPSVGYADEKLGNTDNPLAQNTQTDDGKDPAPYAVIEKAEQAVDLASSPQRPEVTVDAHSNTVRISYAPDISTVRPGETNKYEAELHYEYGLESLPPADGDAGTPAEMKQWEDWSDSRFFGGEKMEAKLPEGYEPGEAPETPGEDDVVKGQCYAWETEDPGFGTRTPLDRDTVYWGMVRLAETHNYKASIPVRAYTDDKPNTPAALALAEEQRADALAAAEAMSAQVLSWVDNKPAESDPEPVLGPAPAVKTYAQSFKILSSEKKSGTDSQQYDIDTLEAVWFTDVQRYTRDQELSAVLRNLVKTRYYNFFWDQAHKARVEMSEETPLDLSVPDLEVEMEVELEDGTVETLPVKVNIGDGDIPVPNSAVLYVSTSGGGGGMIVPEHINIGGAVGGGEGSAGGNGLSYELGSSPVILELEIKPKSAMQEGITWTSSDPKVIQIGPKGELIFVGVGTAEITATTRLTRKSATVTVTVTDPAGLKQGVGVGWEAALELSQREENHFNFYYAGPFFDLDDDYQFHPDQRMTRAELVSVLALFYQEEGKWKWDGKRPFPDVTGREDYAEVVELFYEKGILVGLPNGKFGGQQLATRAEVAAILCRMMSLEPARRGGDEHFFLDYGVDNGWADGYIDALAQAGVVKGTGDNYFNPRREITRAELAAMLGRLLLTGVHYGREPIIPSDVEAEHWAYGLILRAVNTVTPRTE